MAKTETFVINLTGGILSTGELYAALQAAAAARVAHVQFGLRQQMLLEVPQSQEALFLEICKKENIAAFSRKGAPPNIVSSYAAAGLFTTDTWLREGGYKDIFAQFDYTPSLKVNICDRTQNLAPFFTGHINWVSSATPHFWHLFIRFPKTQHLFQWPGTVYTNDIGLLSKKIEEALRAAGEHGLSGEALVMRVKNEGSHTFREGGETLQAPPFSLPYYEGFNDSGGGLWLGLYRRDQLFPVPFLLDLCALCTDAKIGQLYTTPWKSLIIKGIGHAQTEKWNWILGKYRINVRHAANELAWQVEDGDEEGLLIKRLVIRHFDKEDVRTHGLSFGVQSKPTASMFGSIIIRKQKTRNPHRLRSLDRYDLLHTAGFNPNAAELVLFRDGLQKEQLGTYLVSLCKMFYEQQAPVFSKEVSPSKESSEKQPIKGRERSVHQCTQCLTVYDEALGDEGVNISPGTPFHHLPADYRCPLCEAGKEDFREIATSLLHPEAV